MRLRLATAALAVGTAASVTSTAQAEPRGVDWGQALVELDRFARTGSEKPTAPPSAQQHRHTLPPSDDPNPQSLGNAWFGVAPRVTLVARDWASSTRLAGDRLTLVDAMRLSASTRMVVARVRLSGARFAPFVQVGLGQWRVDRAVLPLTPRFIEVASQIGAGVEVRLTRRWQLAAETAMTSLIHEGQNQAVPHLILWSTYLASRVEF